MIDLIGSLVRYVTRPNLSVICLTLILTVLACLNPVLYLLPQKKRVLTLYLLDAKTPVVA
jgi:hypothetical protein